MTLQNVYEFCFILDHDVDKYKPIQVAEGKSKLQNTLECSLRTHTMFTD